MAKAAYAMAGGYIGDVVKDAGALKVRAFAMACSGDLSAVVVDRWAMYCATGEKRVPSGDEYRMIAQCYTEVAAMVGETPADLQAILWVALRDSGEGA
jgi:hypothetical protein